MSAQRTPGPLNYDPADPDKMTLPAGTTCGDCVHIRRCKMIFGHVETDTSCDWSPSRFKRAAATGSARPATSHPTPHPAPVAAPAPAARAAGPFNAPLTLSAGLGEAA